jgi:hypothetical protein
MKDVKMFALQNLLAVVLKEISFYSLYHVLVRYLRYGLQD